jgi:hypothetical protein
MRGTVFLYYSFPFDNGYTKDKYIIILNDPGPNDLIVTCITTSQQDNRPDQEGCHHTHNLFVLNADFDYFPKKTWVQFYRVFKFGQEIFLKLIQKGDIEKKAVLKPQTIQALINCIGKSEDIPYYDLQLIRK